MYQQTKTRHTGVGLRNQSVSYHCVVVLAPGILFAQVGSGGPTSSTSQVVVPVTPPSNDPADMAAREAADSGGGQGHRRGIPAGRRLGRQPEDQGGMAEDGREPGRNKIPREYRPQTFSALQDESEYGSHKRDPEGFRGTGGYPSLLADGRRRIQPYPAGGSPLQAGAPGSRNPRPGTRPGPR